MVNFPEDIKAEIALDLINSNKPNLSYFVEYMGKFTRNFEKDILNYEDVEKHILNPDFEDVTLTIKLNRDGFYKSLPEAMFHDCNRFAKNKNLDPTDFKREYDKQQDEIEYAKRFFSPFENILYRYRIKIERTVNESIFKSFNLLKEYLVDISIDKNLKTYLKRLSILIPFASSIKGDISRIMLSLRFLLNTNVDYETGMQKSGILFRDISLNNRIGNGRLGDNMFCGKSFYEEIYIWSFNIVFNNEMIYDYFSDNSISLLLNKYFTDYFIPNDVDVQYKIKSEEMLNFRLGTTTDKTNRYLGYNLKL